MLSKEEIENMKRYFNECIIKDTVYEEDLTLNFIEVAKKYIEELETREQKLIEKLEDRIKSVEKCYQDLIKSYYDEKLNIINTSSMSKKEKAEFINKKNCLLVQKHCYEEILEILKGENNEGTTKN